jgi:arylsulfatase A-like enzyme
MKTTTATILLLIYVLAGIGDLGRAEVCTRPNVLLIGVETLRADHLGCLGYLRNTTPTLDRLAKQGVVFSRAMATSSWTMPTTMSVFTALYPGVHQMTGWDKKLPAATTTLAQILKRNGYRTAAFVGNPALDADYGFDRGFDLYDDFSVRLSLQSGLFADNEQVTKNIYDGALTNEAVNRAAGNWLAGNYSQPFFMFVFYFDTHHDYVPPPPYDTMFDPNYDGTVNGRGIRGEPRKTVRPAPRDLEHIIALYDGEIRYTDHCIAQLLDKLAQHQILDNTLIVVFGDHGDEFYEHGSTSHAFTLYNEVLNVPLIFRLPTAIEPGRKIDVLVSQVDVMPTVLDYLNIEYDGFVQGPGLRAVIEKEKSKVHDVVYAEVGVEENKVFTAAVGNRYKFILDMETGRREVFDLSQDPMGQCNIFQGLSSAGPVPLENQLSTWLWANAKLADQLSRGRGPVKPQPNEARYRQLKALGYVQ